MTVVCIITIGIGAVFCWAVPANINRHQTVSTRKSLNVKQLTMAQKVYEIRGRTVVAAMFKDSPAAEQPVIKKRRDQRALSFRTRDCGVRFGNTDWSVQDQGCGKALTFEIGATSVKDVFTNSAEESGSPIWPPRRAECLILQKYSAPPRLGAELCCSDVP